MQKSLDSTISFWIKNVPYLWVPGKNVHDSKRFYILGDLTDELSFFNKKNEFMNSLCSDDACLFSFDPKCDVVREYFLAYTWKKNGWKNINSVEEALEYSPYKNNVSVRIEGKIIENLPPNYGKKSITIISNDYDNTFFLYERCFSQKEISYKINCYSSKITKKLIQNSQEKNLYYNISDCVNYKTCKLPHVNSFYKIDYVNSLYNQLSKNYQIQPKEKSFLEMLFDKRDDKNIITTYVNFLKNLVKKPFLDAERGEKKVKEVLDMIPKNKLDNNSVVLDFGAGDGAIISAISKTLKLKKDNAIALDLKPLPDSEFYTYQSEIKNIQSCSVDCIILFEVLHHINSKNHGKILKELKRCLKPDGIIVIKEHDFPDHTKDPYYRIFLDLIHEMWYEYKNEDKDVLWPLENSLNYIGNLLYPLNCFKVDMWTKQNYQRIYRASFTFKTDICVPLILDQNPPSNVKILPVKGSYKLINGKLTFIPDKN